MRLSNATHVFLSEWPSEGATRDTVRTYRSGLTWLCEFAGEDAMLGDLTPRLVRLAAAAKMEGPAAGAQNYKGGEASAALVVHAAKAMATWLGRQGLPVADLSMVRAPRIPKRIQLRVYPDEFQALEAAVFRRLIDGHAIMPQLSVSRDLALLHLLGETGLRAQEVCGLQIADVDFDRGCITTRHGKGKRERALSIMGTANDPDPQRLVRLLGDWIVARGQIARAQTHSMLWTSIHGSPLAPSELRGILSRICEAAGVPGNRPPHAFRRYVFTEHYRNRSAPIQQLAARMGWSDQSHDMVNTYTRGVELELAREPLPLLNSRPVPQRSPRALTTVAAGPARVEFDPTTAPHRTGKSAARRALTNPQRASHTAP